jgi:hypothetical protein
MRKKKVHGLPVLVLCCILIAALTQSASAELLAGVQLGYGQARYSQILGEKGTSSTEWSSSLWARYPYEDVLISALYQGSLGLQGFSSSRHLAHAGVSYLFLEEDMLKVYGGIGYNLVSAKLPVTGDEHNTFTGHGFTGQVVMDIEITDELWTSATVIANPWAKWSHTLPGPTKHVDASGSAFAYKLELNYDFSEEFSAHLSLLGNTFSVPKYEDTGQTKGSSVSINLGVTREF